MKSLIVLLMTASLTLPVLAATPQSHESAHGAADAHQLQLNAGKKWATDAPLRQGMNRIRSALVPTLAAIEAGKATTADHEAFGAAVNKQVAYIVENCKLDPKADEQLHVVVAELASAAEIAGGKHPGEDRAQGVLKAGEALNAYGKHFNHPGWKAVKLGH